MYTVLKTVIYHVIRAKRPYCPVIVFAMTADCAAAPSLPVTDSTVRWLSSATTKKDKMTSNLIKGGRVYAEDLEHTRSTGRAGWALIVKQALTLRGLGVRTELAGLSLLRSPPICGEWPYSDKIHTKFELCLTCTLDSRTISWLRWSGQSLRKDTNTSVGHPCSLNRYAYREGGRETVLMTKRKKIYI